MKNKRQLRSELRRRRRALSQHEQKSAAAAALRFAGPLLLRFRRIAFYIPADGELDVLPILNTALWRGIACYLPQIPHRSRRRMRFSPLTGRPNWYANRFGIPEHWAHRPARVWQLGAILLPLVGFDRQGRRLGMGGGFYDATLAYLRYRRHWRRPTLIGVAHACQEVDKLPEEPWDIPLDAILTDKGLHYFHHKR